MQLYQKHHYGLLPLLAFYIHGDHYNFIFPLADGDLMSYLRHQPPPINVYERLKFIEAISILPPALGVIHNGEPAHKGDADKPETYGYHRDLKPQNILFIKIPIDESQQPDGTPEDRLFFMIADFGLTRFRRSDPNDSSGIPFEFDVSTYRAPEIGIDRYKKVGRAADIWSLGCIFSDVVTFSLLGFDGVEESMMRRQAAIKQDISHDGKRVHKRDIFHDGKMVKPEVLDWFKELVEKDRDDTFVGDFINLIKNMLDEDPERRPKIGVVEQDLNAMIQKERKKLGTNIGMTEGTIIIQNSHENTSPSTPHDSDKVDNSSDPENDNSLDRENSIIDDDDSMITDIDSLFSEDSISSASSNFSLLHPAQYQAEDAIAQFLTSAPVSRIILQAVEKSDSFAVDRWMSRVLMEFSKEIQELAMERVQKDSLQLLRMLIVRTRIAAKIRYLSIGCTDRSNGLPARLEDILSRYPENDLSTRGVEKVAWFQNRETHTPPLHYDEQGSDQDSEGEDDLTDEDEATEISLLAVQSFDTASQFYRSDRVQELFLQAVKRNFEFLHSEMCEETASDDIELGGHKETAQDNNPLGMQVLRVVNIEPSPPVGRDNICAFAPLAFTLL
ncbi:kinase-like domain-containing protein [Trichophaea hybrida]|nr:kinase-like domain-containing protein [Trichophaea hybrida]